MFVPGGSCDPSDSNEAIDAGRGECDPPDVPNPVAPVLVVGLLISVEGPSTPLGGVPGAPPLVATVAATAAACDPPPKNDANGFNLLAPAATIGGMLARLALLPERERVDVEEDARVGGRGGGRGG